jgi:hypothetical protein
LPGCRIVVFFWPSSVTLTVSASKDTCSLHVPLARMVSPGLTLAMAALMLCPASQSTEAVAALAGSADVQMTASNIASLVFTRTSFAWLIDGINRISQD